MFTPKRIWAGVGFASLAAVVVAGGWTLGTHQTTGAGEVDEAPSVGNPTGAPTIPPVSPSQADGQNEEEEPPTEKRAPDHEQPKDGQAGPLLPSAPAPTAPSWPVFFGQQGDQTAEAFATKKSVERHLTEKQTDLLDEIALTLPGSASDWLTIESAADGDSKRFANEILDVLSTNKKIKALNAGLTEPGSRGIFVTVSSQTDKHFFYAQLIAQALSTPDKPVHLGPAKDPKPGIVKIIILPAEPATPTERARK